MINMNEETSELRKGLGIDDWLELIKEDKNLKGAYICFGQYMDILEKREKQLQNNWNELKKIIEQDIRKCEELIEMCPKELRNTIIGTRSYEEIIGYNKYILSKMQELQGDDKNE